MRGWPLCLLALTLACALGTGAAAQRLPPRPVVKQAPAVRPSRITAAQATATALARVRALLDSRALVWGDPQHPNMPPKQLAVGDGQALSWPDVNVVIVTSERTGHVRVVMDAFSGSEISVKWASWDWRKSSDSWFRGT